MTAAVQYGKEFPAGGRDRDDRYLETWNLVFMQFSRSPDGRKRRCQRPKHRHRHGPGAARADLAGRADRLRNRPVRADRDESGGDRECRLRARREGRSRAADHLRPQPRASRSSISDGVLPSNEGRGYVLRRVLRRLIRQGRLLGIERPFATETVGAVIEKMARSLPGTARARGAHPPRRRARGRDIRPDTCRRGSDASSTLAQELQRQGTIEIPGEQAFRLYDTFGFPPDLTRELAGEQGLTIDEPGFEARDAGAT